MPNLRTLAIVSLALLAACKGGPVSGDPGGVYEVPTGDWNGGSGGTARIDVSHCTGCHGQTGRDNANADPLVAAAPPVTPLGGGDSDPSTGAHLEHLRDRTLHRWFECASCHLVPTSFPHDVPQRMGKVTFSRRATTDWSGAPIVPAPTWDPTARTCASTYCHGNFPNGNHSNVVSWSGSAGCGTCHGLPPAGSHPSIGGQGCDTCHGAGYASGQVDPDLHVNGRLDGGGEPANGGMDCGGCHGTILSAMSDAGRASKHSLGSLAGTNDSPTDSGITWASPLSGNAADQRSCVNMCHGDHPHDLTSPSTGTHESNAYADASTSATRASGSANRIGAGGTGTQNRTKTDFDPGLPNGGLCASCHRNSVDANRPAIDAAAFDASAHDGTRTTGATTYDWSYRLHDGGLFARNCTKCHASNTEGRTPAASAGGPAVHFGENASILSGTKNPAGTPAGFVCYNCHGTGASPAAGAQGDRSGKDIQSQIAHATSAGQSGHPASSDAVHDTVTEQASATFANALGAPAGTGQRHASCLDCHDPHKAKSGTHVQGTNMAGPSLEGAWGVRLATNPAFWTAPTSANLVKTTITGTEREATLCFKCHSSFYGTLPAAPSSSPSFAETDTAKEFNPANVGNFAGGSTTSWTAGETAGSFHPVLASAGSNLGATNNIKASWTRTSLMTCSDCHGSDQTTDPNGPHGSAAKFVLKGPATAWNNTILNGASMPSNVFCSNCHNTSWSTSRFTNHGISNHGIPCFNCHSAIPHGAPRPGFLNPMAGTNTTNLPAIAGYDNAAPYAQPGTGSRLYLVSYPATSASSWSQGNCGCNGSGH